MKEDKIASILKNFLVSVTYVLTTKSDLTIKRAYFYSKRLIIML